MIKKSVDVSSTTNWNRIWEVRLNHCYCLALNTDLESFMYIEGHEDNCIDKYIKQLESEGLIVLNSVEVVSNQPVRRGLARAGSIRKEDYALSNILNKEN